MNDVENLKGFCEDKISVKFLGNYGDKIWLRQFPEKRAEWGRCNFDLDRHSEKYDWLVVYNDLPDQRKTEPLSQNRALILSSKPYSACYD